MKKILTVLLALSVVFTYTVGTAFAAVPTTEEKTTLERNVDNAATKFQLVVRGDAAKPLTLVKSFKWLATSEDISNAENFVSTLPPTDPENPNATLEELLAAQAEAERIANENIFQKAVRKTGEFFVNFKKDKKEK